MKKLKYLIILLFMFAFIKGVYAFDNTLKVYDYAQILTEKEEKNLKTQIDNYINKHNTDMAIVTVKYYNQNSLEEYMNLFYYQNNFGLGNTKDGLIIFIDLKNKEEVIDIKVNGITANLYTEEEINKIKKSTNEEDSYYNKLLSIMKNLDKYISYNNENITIVENDKKLSLDWFSIIMFSILIPTIVVVIGIFKNRTIKRSDDANLYIIKESVNITTRDDKFITTNTKKERTNSK